MHNFGPRAHGAVREEEFAMECTVRWQADAGMAFVAETGSGHLLAMDGAPDGGGRNLAPRPMETVLAGTGGCTAYDVVLILKRGRQQVSGCSVKIDAERAESEPKVFTRIHMHFTVSGKSLSEPAVARAIQLSHEKYCSASAMLAKTAVMTTGFDIVEA
jgi:putative redox protein